MTTTMTMIYDDDDDGPMFSSWTTDRELADKDEKTRGGINVKVTLTNTSKHII